MAKLKFNKHLLLELIHSRDGIVNILGKTFEGEIDLEKDDFKEDALIFKDCVFEDEVSFSHIAFKYALIFIDCKFHASLSLNDLNIPNYNNEIKFVGVSVYISDCTFNDFFSIADCLFHGSIELNNITVTNRFSIFNLKHTHQNAAVIINNSHFQSIFSVSHVNLLSFFKIYNSELATAVDIVDLKCWALIFNNSTLHNSLAIDDCKIHSQLRFLKCKIKNDCHFSQLIANKLLLNRCHFESYLVLQLPPNISAGGISDITIKACDFHNGASFVGVRHPNDYSFLNSLNITASRHLKGHLKFKDLYVNNVYLRGTNYDSHIVFENIHILKFNFDYFTNYDNLQINKFSAIQQSDSTLNIYASSLGKTSFSNCLLNSFSNVSIIDSLLTDISAINVDWPSFNLINHGKGSNITYKQNRELYRQLKLAMAAQGDMIQSSLFKRNEMHAFFRETFKNKGNWNDKIILILSWTNDFGLKWWRPLWLLGIATILFSFFILVSLNYQIHNLPIVLFEYKKLAVVLLNPAHSLQSVFGENTYISGFMYFWDIAYRVFYAYLVFQIVSAFRKYLK
jgi:hypothetical protein